MPLFRSLRLSLVVALGTLVVGACETPPPADDTPQITFRHLPKITFDVARIEIEQSYVPPQRPPNVEHLFPERPGELAARWARDRLVAAGNSGILRYTVRQASVIETPLETKSDLSGVFTNEQSERYDARLVVLAVLVDGAGVERAHASVQADRWVTVAEDYTMVDRERVWFRMAEQLVKDMGAEMEARLRENMGRYIRP